MLAQNIPKSIALEPISRIFILSSGKILHSEFGPQGTFEFWLMHTFRNVFHLIVNTYFMYSCTYHKS